MKKAIKKLLILIVITCSFILLSIDDFEISIEKGGTFIIDENTHHYNIGSAVKSSTPEDFIEEPWITDLIQENNIDTLVVVEASKEFQEMVNKATNNSFRNQ